MGNKVRLITPFLMLLAGAIASIIMYIRGYELTRMLWGLLIVLVIFYILGDIARYLYASIRPRIIPSGDLEKMVLQARKNSDITGNVVAFADDEQTGDADSLDADGLMSENTEEYSDGYSDEELEEYETADDNADEYEQDMEYTDEYDESSL